jgi:DNA-binding response OmpR family regulator
VLVIDDDPDFRELVTMVGTSVGVEVLEAETCVEGLNILMQEQDRITLLLLDYFLPGLTPVRCVEALRRTTSDRVPIVLVTAAVDAAARATELGLSRWLAKPFDLAELVGLLEGSPEIRQGV